MTMHHLSAEEIAAYLDGECADAEHRATQQHLESCANCRHMVDDQLFIKTLMGSLAEPELPRSFVLPADMGGSLQPLVSPVEQAPVSAPGKSLIQFEPFARLLSIAAVIALLVLGGAQLAGVGDQSTTETDTPVSALQEQEPALARGEVREQGESAATNAGPLGTENARVDTQTQAADNGLTLIEITTIGVGLVALVSIASWILIHYRAGNTGNNS